MCVCVCVCVWQCDWVCHSRVTAQGEGVRERGVEEDVWALEGSAGNWRKLHNGSFMICAAHKILFLWSSRRMSWTCCMCVAEVK